MSAQPIPLMRCADCGRLDSPGRVVCAGCLSARLESTSVPGDGRLATWTTIRRAPARFRDDAPYDVAVVDLDAGPRVTGRLAGGSAPASVGGRVAARPSPAGWLVFEVLPTDSGAIPGS